MTVKSILTSLALALSCSSLQAYELSADAGQYRADHEDKTYTSGMREVTMSLNSVAIGSKWSALATCGLQKPNDNNSAAMVQIVQNLPTDQNFYFVFSVYENGKKLKQQILADDLALGTKKKFNLSWDNGNIELSQNQLSVASFQTTFKEAKFYCSISSGGGLFEIKR